LTLQIDVGSLRPLAPILAFDPLLITAFTTNTAVAATFGSRINCGANKLTYSSLVISSATLIHHFALNMKDAKHHLFTNLMLIRSRLAPAPVPFAIILSRIFQA
jgi:hypothetical protein